MHHNELIKNGSNFALNFLLFLLLLTLVSFIYLESNMIIDAVYFSFIIFIFAKFIFIKLYR